MPDVLDLPAIEAIGRNVHDAFFRAMLSDPARAEAVIRTHWPRQLHWMLKGESPRHVDSGLVRGDLSQRRTDSLFLVGGQGQRPRALFVPEHKFRVESRTSGQIAEYLDTLREGLRPAASAWLVPVVFFTGEGHWNLPGVIDESSDEEREILRQMQWPGSCFLRQTRAIDYGRLSCEPVSRVMLGMMGLAGQNPYRREELRRMWREDAAGRVVGWALRRQFLSFALATSPLSKEELLELALETGLVSREVKMSVITQPLILDALEKGESEGMSKGMSKGLSMGMSKGISKGMSRGMSKLLLGLFQKRFGKIPEEVERKVRSATQSDLEAWAGAFVDAKSLDDVFRNGRCDREE